MQPSMSGDTKPTLFEKLQNLSNTVDSTRVGELMRDAGFAFDAEARVGIYRELANELESFVFGLAEFTESMDFGDLTKGAKSVVFKLTAPEAKEYPLSGIDPSIVDRLAEIWRPVTPWSHEMYNDVKARLAEDKIELMVERQVLTWHLMMSVLPEAVQDLLCAGSYSTIETMDTQAEAFHYLLGFDSKTPEEVDKDAQRDRGVFPWERIKELVEETANTTTKDQVRKAARLFAEKLPLEDVDRGLLAGAAFAMAFLTGLNFPVDSSSARFDAKVHMRNGGIVLNAAWESMREAGFAIAVRLDEVILETRKNALRVRAAEYAQSPLRPEPAHTRRDSEQSTMGFGTKS